MLELEQRVHRRLLLRRRAFPHESNEWHQAAMLDYDGFVTLVFTQVTDRHGRLRVARVVLRHLQEQRDSHLLQSTLCVLSKLVHEVDDADGACFFVHLLPWPEPLHLDGPRAADAASQLSTVVHHLSDYAMWARRHVAARKQPNHLLAAAAEDASLVIV